MGGRLVCEFALFRQEETESYEVNSFPFGQTHVGFTNSYFKETSRETSREINDKFIPTSKARRVSLRIGLEKRKEAQELTTRTNKSTR